MASTAASASIGAQYPRGRKFAGEWCVSQRKREFTALVKDFTFEPVVRVGARGNRVVEGCGKAMGIVRWIKVVCRRTTWAFLERGTTFTLSSTQLLASFVSRIYGYDTLTISHSA